MKPAIKQYSGICGLGTTILENINPFLNGTWTKILCSWRLESSNKVF